MSKNVCYRIQRELDWFSSLNLGCSVIFHRKDRITADNINRLLLNPTECIRHSSKNPSRLSFCSFSRLFYKDCLYSFQGDGLAFFFTDTEYHCIFLYSLLKVKQIN